MIRRFIYHSFWNFYDHLGTLILMGAGHSLVSLGIAVLAISLAGALAATIPVMIIAGVLQFALLVLILSALLPYCARAARGAPARFVHLREGVKSKGWVVARILFLLSFVYIVLGVNFNFYLPMQGQTNIQSVRLMLIFIVAIIGWTCMFLYVFLPPWLSAVTAVEAPLTARTALKKGMLAVALTPSIWLFIAVAGVVLLIGGLYTRIGIILVIPLMCSISQTAYQLAGQYAAFLAVAREEKGPESNLRNLKSRAKELGWEWEYAQPRRTFKELIRPWDY